MKQQTFIERIKNFFKQLFRFFSDIIIQLFVDAAIGMLSEEALALMAIE